MVSEARTTNVAWARLCNEATELPISPRALLVDGPVTVPVRAPTKRETAPHVIPSTEPSLRRPSAVLAWRTGVVAAVATVAAALLVVAASSPSGPERPKEQLAAVGAAAPPTATAVHVETTRAAESRLPTQPSHAAMPIAAAPPFVEEVVYVEEDDDEGVAVETTSHDRAAARARARDVARALTKRARVAKALGDLGGAQRLSRDALAALPTYAPAAADMAAIHLQRGETRRGLSYARRAARSAPRKLSYMVLLGDAYAALGRHADARAEWRRASEWGSSRAKARLAAR